MNKRIALILALAFSVLSATAVFAKEARVKQGKTVFVKTGREFVLTLVSNKSTGYQWQLTRAPGKDFLVLTGLRYITDKNKRAGYKVKEEWTFKALKPGSTRVDFQYVRPWDKKSPPARSKTFLVIIK